MRRRAVAGGASAVVDGPSRPPPSGAMLGGGRFAGTVLGAGRARGFGAGTEPGGGRDGGPRGFGTGWSGNLIASGALTGRHFHRHDHLCGNQNFTARAIDATPPRHRVHPTHWLIFTQTATGSATSRDAGPGTRGFF